MAIQVICECGFTIRAESEDDVAALTREHIRRDHPELVDTVTVDMIHDWVEVVP
jgi:predicted small metal-binding protein